MASKSLLQLKGFGELLEKIQKADGSIDKAADSCVRQSAQILQNELKAQMQADGVESDLINSMPPPQITVEGNRYGAAVGYKKGSFDPRNPSDGYKVVFLNYGTPRRTMHGKVKARGFIEKAKKKARPRIKKAQQETLENILEKVSK
jgi:hypothetical protein